MTDWHVVKIEAVGPEGFTVTTTRRNPAKPGAVTGQLTYYSFLSSIKGETHWSVSHPVVLNNTYSLEMSILYLVHPNFLKMVVFYPIVLFRIDPQTGRNQHLLSEYLSPYFTIERFLLQFE